jgi:CheY-like chemotaxis protein
VAEAPLIVIAHESETIREAICHQVADAGYRVRSVGGGLALRDELRLLPAALVLDVALPEVHAYEIVEEAKRLSTAPAIVLVASIYNRTGYKRRPTSLYGADDYVEQHHIPDQLLPKLERLVGLAPMHVEPPSAHAETDDGRKIRDAGERRLSLVGASTPNVRDAQPTPPGGVSTRAANATPANAAATIERAQRLAWLIVSDIALYNGDALDAADHHGHTDELEARLRIDLEEGRLLFDLRVPEEVRRTRDFISEALDAIRQKRRAGVGT